MADLGTVESTSGRFQSDRPFVIGWLAVLGFSVTCVRVGVVVNQAKGDTWLDINQWSSRWARLRWALLLLPASNPVCERLTKS